MAKGGKGEAEQGIQAAGQQAYERGKATPQETSQYQGSFNLGNLIQQILQYQQGTGQAPQGYLDPTQQYLQQGGELGQALYGQTLKDVQDPYASYESTLQPQLQLAQDQINRSAQQRGLLRSGMPIEQMGRAGAELAIQEANARMQYRQQGMSNASNLSNTMYGQSQNNLTALQNLYSGQQTYGQNAMARQAGQAQVAAQYQAYPYQYQLGQSGGNLGGLGTAAGAGIGALLALPTGGMSVLGGAALGGMLGGGTGSMIKY